ncbi:PrpF domain-containing protein [Streptomyces litchfieldiae]|uniref:PrpF domain-containing protein n=1 Tax=Streptomyces litchfieldiae TaxID=3075543 RepID=A0ABU2MZ01_9ACTN|nr:PrpF domain-containing protein [Streptomyces sp. DSM 44938]MDT0346882.1 PrpF domain-containing protein [Streptomyces sp. DSM 44938]
MIGHLAYAAGSPCPTIVLDSSRLPQDTAKLLESLTEVRRYLAAAGGAHVLKFALMEPSEHPMFDLDYRFVQALPGGPDRFDLRGSCGHSILSAVLAAERAGVLPKLTAGQRIRVNVLNNGDSVVCEVDGVDRDEVQFTVYFVRPDAVPVTRLLLTGEPATELTVDGERHEVSLVSSGNAYVFVDARSLGLRDHGELFSADAALFDRLSRIRVAAAGLLDWPAEGAFPKVAAIMPMEAGRIAARAISVPRWHPTIALTGAVCLGSAIQVPGTIPWRVAHEMGCVDGLIDIATPGGDTAVTAATADRDGGPALLWAAAGRKRVTFQGSFLLEPLAYLHFEEIAQCLAETAMSS